MSNLLFPLLTIINKRYQDERYYAILDGFSILHSNLNRYSCYVNLHRVFSLVLTWAPEWESEFEYMQERGQLELLGSEDAKYINLYLIFIADGTIDLLSEFDSLNFAQVSKRTKKYFPIDLNKLRVILVEQKIDNIQFLNWPD